MPQLSTGSVRNSNSIVDTVGSSSIGRVRRRLETGQRQLARNRLQAGALLLALGIVLGGAYEAMYMHVERTATQCFWCTSAGYVYTVVDATLFHSRLIVVTLAPVTQSLRIMRLAIAIDVVGVLLADGLHLLLRPEWLDDSIVVMGVLMLIDLFFVAFALRAACCENLQRMRLLIWRALAMWTAACVPILVYVSVRLSIQTNCFSAKFLWIAVQVATLALMLMPGWHERLRAALTRLLVTRSSQRAAAGVAALVGNCEAQEALALAERRFRCVRLCDLCQEDFADNAPDHSLAAKSEACKLQRCDAFISHSWHDDPAAKWEAMQRWRADFVLRYGREPLVWIDKCCIDQMNIEQDLRCLPIFVSGCTTFLVCCGPTYLTRLWCVVEVFSFVHMGGSISNMHFEPLCKAGREKEDFDSLRATVENFDARSCDCHLPEDKARMLAIVEEAFGDVSGFNTSVREIFQQSTLAQLVASVDPDGPVSPVLLADAVRKQSSGRAGDMSARATSDTGGDLGDLEGAPSSDEEHGVFSV